MRTIFDGVDSAPAPDHAPVSVSDQPEESLPIASQDLLQGRRQVWIDHDGTLYCLKATSNGRLYLTK